MLAGFRPQAPWCPAGFRTAWLISLLVGAVPNLPAATPAPYPYSIFSVHWDFSTIAPLRKAHGSDLWPLTWTADGNLFGAWGDGGGFGGNSDHVGRVSLGFALITGQPRQHDPTSYSGTNVWGDAPRYARWAATFGGKVGTLLALGGTFFAYGSLWLGPAGVHKGDSGNVQTAIWSTDQGRTWHIAPWSTDNDLGTFLNFGPNYRGARDGYVYIYYMRRGDNTHVYLRRCPMSRLLADPDTDSHFQHLTGVDRQGRPQSWSAAESDAGAVFFDPHHVLGPEVVYDAGLRRYLLSVGHSPSDDGHNASAGQMGLFESRYPWGPWRTLDYEDDWGHLGVHTAGDFLGLHLPAKWMSRNGNTLWCVFSSGHEFDSFNLVRAHLRVRRGRAGH